MACHPCLRSLLPGLVSLMLLASPGFALAATPAGQTSCPDASPAPGADVGQAGVWDDAKIRRAQSALTSLEVSRSRLTVLIKRARAAEQSARYAENFGRSGEANYWRYDDERLRLAIDTELGRAKPLAAVAGVRCGGCSYSTLIAKMRKAIEDATAVRSAMSRRNPPVPALGSIDCRRGRQ